MTGDKTLSKEEIISFFEDGRQRYLGEPVFHAIIHQLYRGDDPIKILDAVLISHKQANEDNTKLRLLLLENGIKLPS
jgi:hypothetical protein